MSTAAWMIAVSMVLPLWTLIRRGHTMSCSPGCRRDHDFVKCGNQGILIGYGCALLMIGLAYLQGSD